MTYVFAVLFRLAHQCRRGPLEGVEYAYRFKEASDALVLFIANQPMTEGADAFDFRKLARAYVMVMQERGDFKPSSADDTIGLTDAVVRAGGDRLFWAVRGLDFPALKRLTEILRARSMH